MRPRVAATFIYVIYVIYDSLIYCANQTGGVLTWPLPPFVTGFTT
jgi:hypothetical protein